MSQKLSSPAEYEKALRRWNDRLVAACRSLLTIDIPEDAAYGLIWYQYEGDGDALPLCIAWSDREHGIEVPYPSPFRIPIDEPWREPKDTEDSDRGDILFRWVHRGWESAGGASSGVPFYGYNYHTGEHFCFRRGRQVSQREIESDLAESTGSGA